MQQNYLISPKLLPSPRSQMPPPLKKFYSTPNPDSYPKSSLASEANAENSYEKLDQKQRELRVVTDADDIVKSGYSPGKKKSLSINVTPKSTLFKAFSLSPNNSDGQVYEQRVKNRAHHTGPINQFEIFMKRLSKLQLHSILPHPEPVKHSEKAYGTIKGFGICTNQGLVRNYNEDRVSIILNVVKPATNPGEQQSSPCSIFGLFDGHGGTKCADFLRNRLHNFIVQSPHFPNNMQEALRVAFDETEKAFTEESLAKLPGNHEKSGSCALVLVLYEDTCYIANLGDSRAVLSQNSGQSVYALTRDHKPSDKQEQKRVTDAGGRVYQNTGPQTVTMVGTDTETTAQETNYPCRILPGKLSVSRAFGDIEAKLPQFGGNPNVLIARPEITKLKLNQDHDFIVLGCDGIFDRLSNEEVVSSVWDTVNKNKAANIHEMMGTIAENTIKTALLSKSFDNVTAIVVGFGNLEQAFNNNAKTFNQKSSVKTEVNMLSYDNNLKRAMPKNVPIYNLNTLMKGSQRSGAIRVLPEVKSLTKVEASNFEMKEDQNEMKENSLTESSPKRYLPNIGTAKHGHAFQSHRK